MKKIGALVDLQPNCLSLIYHGVDMKYKLHQKINGKCSKCEIEKKWQKILSHFIKMKNYE
jgi:hypothetical protein